MSKTKINLEGKVALISGANRGIGKAFAEEFLKNGAKKVYAGARNIESLSGLKEKYGGRLVPVEIDVTNQATLNRIAEQINDVDVLVNNAGVLAPGSFLSNEAVESLNQHFEVNVAGLIRLTNAVIDKLKKRESAAIVNVASIAGLANMPVIGPYSASKAVVHSITQGMRGELANENILVAGVYPGPIDTDMAKGFEMDKDSPENVAKNVVKGLAEGAEDIFPDSMSQQMGGLYENQPKELERQFAAYTG